MHLIFLNHIDVKCPNCWFFSFDWIRIMEREFLFTKIYKKLVSFFSCFFLFLTSCSYPFEIFFQLFLDFYFGNRKTLKAHSRQNVSSFTFLKNYKRTVIMTHSIKIRFQPFTKTSESSSYPKATLREGRDLQLAYRFVIIGEQSRMQKGESNSSPFCLLLQQWDGIHAIMVHESRKIL